MQTQGVNGLVYHKPLSFWETMLFSLATKALPAEERNLLFPLADFAHNKPWWKAAE